MKDQIRAEFEQEFPLPNGVTFDGDHYVADPAVMGAFQNATIWSHMFRGWKARAQPARQVGGDEREAFEVAWPTPKGAAFSSEKGRYWREDDQECCYQTINRYNAAWWAWKARAALAPAAVVIPKTELWQCQNTENRNLVYLPYKPQGPWDCVEYVRRDEVARLNRNAIPVELLESLSRSACRLINEVREFNVSGVYFTEIGDNLQHLMALEMENDELRALLGKEGE